MSDSGDDQWLYGDSINPEPPEIGSEVKETSEDTVTQDEQMEIGEETVPPEKRQLEPPSIAPPGVDMDVAAAPEALENGADETGTPLEDGQIVDPTDPPVEGREANGDVEDDDEDDSDEDDVQVVIGDIKVATNYSNLNIKRGGLLTSTGTGEKMKQPGKFSIEEFETVGTINGQEAIDFNLDSMEEKPWRKPGADITDYFNYGFNEETWRAYCERQKRIRVQDSGVGLLPLGGGGGGTGGGIGSSGSGIGGFLGQKKAGPPPGRRYTGCIDVIGGGGLASRRGLDKGVGLPPKENVIQVMTADRRDYSRKPGFPDMSMPPPPSGMQPPFDLPPPPHGGGVIQRIGPPAVPPPFTQHLDPYGNPIGGPMSGPMGGGPMGPPHPHGGGGGGGDFYGVPPPEVDPYYHSYEPTQDCQWDPMRKPTWQPTNLATLSTGVKVLTPGPVPPQPPVIQPPGSKSAAPTLAEVASQDSQDATSSHGSLRDTDDGPTVALGVVIKEEPRDPEERRERTRERSEKHKERSHRHRSRSRSTERRSRRHKSRSRSPGHRSHRKKKSKRAERERSKEESE